MTYKIVFTFISFKHICWETAEKKTVERSFCALPSTDISNAVCMAYPGYLANIQHTRNLLISPKLCAVQFFVMYTIHL